MHYGYGTAFSVVYSNQLEGNVREHTNNVRRTGKLIQRHFNGERNLLESFRTLSFETENLLYFRIVRIAVKSKNNGTIQYTHFAGTWNWD